MKKESKEMLKMIISNQELIMKALKIEIPPVKTEKENQQKTVKKAPVKKMVKKTTSK